MLCRNEEEARKDADRRAAILAGLDRKLAHGDKALVSSKGFRRFVKTIGSGNFSIDYDKVEVDAKFDGLFVLRTNTKLSALQVVLRYRNLLAVEDTFKTTKALLTTRPIFHKTDAAIRGHIFCSFLAVLLRKELFDPPRAVTAISNGSTSSMISTSSAKSRSSRTAAARCCEPPQAPRSIPYAAPSASRCHPSSRRSRPRANQPDRVVPKTSDGSQVIDAQLYLF